MKLIKLIALFSSLLIASATTSFAQVYPIQATVQLTPPYSLYLSDYVESGTERLALNVFLADIARPQLDIYFRLRIVGQGITIETKPEYKPAPMSIQGGVPLRLISTDLADYFNPNNLNFQGLTRREYDQRGKLPEGVYQFCFEVLEYNRGLKISNTACAAAWMVLNDPPIVNLPRQDEKLKVLSPQNVLLQWTPRHTGSPNSAFTTVYDVSMVEVWPATRTPNDAVLSSPPIFTTTTNSTTLIYGPAETPLEPGRRYAFRVRARSMTGVDELDLFKNNGYSEVISFVYGDACDLPTGITAGSVGTSKFSLSWDGLFNHTAYKVRYREQGTTNWYQNDVTNTTADIYSLKPQTVYEYQVAATCGLYDGNYSPLAKITTNPLPEAEYVCGVPLQTFNIDPAELTGSLKVGDIIDAGDFDVKLTKVSGSNGVFTGEGVIEVPYFNKAKVKASFTGITVNKALRMVNGYMKVTGAAVEVIPQGVLDAIRDLDEVLDAADSALDTIEENLPQQFDPNSFVPDTALTVKEGIHSVYKDDNGTIVIVDNKGQETRLPAGTSAAIKDDSGNGYLVDKNGKVHKTTSDVVDKVGNRKYNLTLTFAEARNMQYGFDNVKDDALAKDYEQLSNYSVPWKSVASGGATDAVAAVLGGSGFDHKKISFEQSGVPLQAQPFAGNQTTLSVRGSGDGIEEGLLALYTASDTGKVQVLGKINVVSYNKISRSVVIVPVNKATLPSGISAQTIQDSLNAIYKQAVVDWKVSLASPITASVGDPFDDGDSELLSNYTSDMKQVIKAYGNLQDETFYLFLVNNPKSSDGLGYMPRGKQAGFIFVDHHGTNKGALLRTMAHELGHGAFNLHHTFKEPNFTLTKGATDNLMDYPNGNKLYKYQWDKMRYPDIVIGLFEEDEEGENLGEILSFTFEPAVEAAKTCRVTPDGRLFDISGLGDYRICGSSAIYDYITTSLWKPVIGTNKEVIDYDEIIYKFKKGENGKFGEYYQYNHKTDSFVEGKAPLKLETVETCATILQKLIPDNHCAYTSIRNPNRSNGSKNYLNIKGSPTPITSPYETVSFIEDQIANISGAAQYQEALFLTTAEKIANNCNYTLGESDCANINVETLKTQKTEIIALIDNGTVEDLVKKINEVGICVLLEIPYEQIEKAFDKLAEQSSISGETESAIILVMRSINSTNYNIFTEHLQGKDKSYKTLAHLIYGIDGDNYKRFIETMSAIVTGVKNNDNLKWSFVNAWVTERYGSIKDHEKAGLTSIFLSMGKYQDFSEKIPQITDVFLDLLLKDLEDLKEFSLVYEVAILRQANLEIFAKYTQVDVTLSNPGVIMCIPMYSPTSSSDELNWLKPVPVTLKRLNCPNNGGTANNIQEITEEKLPDFYPWSLFLQNNAATAERYESDETKPAYIQTFITQFKAYITTTKQDNDGFWKDYVLPSYCNDLESTIAHIQTSENATTLKKVDKKLRLDLIKSMFACNNNNVNNQLWKLDYSENVLIKLLTSFDKNDNAIITALEQIGISKICEQLEGDQFSRVSLWLSAQLQSCKLTKPLAANQVLDAEGGVKSLFNGNTFIGEDKILQLEADMFQWKNFSGSFTSPTTAKTEIGNFEYNQEVLVYVAGDFEFMEQTIRKGSILQMPLIQAYAMSKSNRSIVMTKTIWTTIDLATLAIGLGEIKIFFKAGQALTKAIVITDIAASTAGTIVNALNENYISPQLRSKIQLLSIVGSAPQILRSIGKIDKLIQQADNALNEIRGITNVNRSAESYLAAEKYVSSLYERLRQARAISSKFDELLKTMGIASDFSKNYNSLTDELKAIFRADFSDASGDILKQLNKPGSEFFEGWKNFRKSSPGAAICAN